MAYYTNGQGASPQPPPPPSSSYGVSLPYPAGQGHIVRRTPSFDAGDDARFGDGRPDFQTPEVHEGQWNGAYRTGSFLRRPGEELSNGMGHPQALQPNRSSSHTTGLVGYRHQYQPQMSPPLQAPYNPQQFAQVQAPYAQQPYNNALGLYGSNHQPYNPAAYGSPGWQPQPPPSRPTHAQYSHFQPVHTGRAPALPPVAPLPETPSSRAPNSSEWQYGSSNQFAPPLSSPPRSRDTVHRVPVYSPPAPPPPPVPPDFHNPGGTLSPSAHASFIQDRIGAQPDNEREGFGAYDHQDAEEFTLAMEGNAPHILMPSGPSPPLHASERMNSLTRHPHSRPLPGPPVGHFSSPGIDSDPEYPRWQRPTEEELAQDNILKEVEAALMSRDNIARTERRYGHLQTLDDPTASNEINQPEPLFSRSRDNSPKAPNMPHSNGYYGSSETGNYNSQDAYDDDSDAEAAAGLAAMRMAEEDEAANEARRQSVQGSAGGTYGSPSQPHPQGHDRESDDSDYANVDMDFYGGGYGGHISYGEANLRNLAERQDPDFMDNRNDDFTASSLDTVQPSSGYQNVARVDTAGTGGLSEPGLHGRRLSYDDDDETSWASHTRRESDSQSPSNDEFPEMFYHPGMQSFRNNHPLPPVPFSSERPLPQLMAPTEYRPAAQSSVSFAPTGLGAMSAHHLNAPAGLAVPRSTSLSSHSSTPQTIPPVRSKTDAEERKAKILKYQQLGITSVVAASESDFEVTSPPSVATLDLPSIPAGKRKRFNLAKLSTADFKKCNEPWALSGITAWIRDMSADESDLKETAIRDGIVALFTHKVPTMNTADAETLAARIVQEMFKAGALVHEEEWVKLSSGTLSGVVWQLTGSGCYAPRLHSAAIPGRCYSHHCSRTLKKINLQTQVLEPQRKLEDWATFYRVQKEDIENVNKKEVERQNILHEIVQTEDQYMDQLNVLLVLYRDHLLAMQPPIVQPSRLEPFTRDVFGKVEAVKKVNEDFLLAQLKYRQQEQGPWIVGFSDIFREWIRKAKKAYTEYAANFPHATMLVRKEAERNILFRQFLDQARENERSKRLGWDTYLKAPITRLQRYGLLLYTVHKNTVQDTEEKANLAKAMEEIKVVTMECDVRVADMTKKVDLAELGHKLIIRPGLKHVELNLNHLGRELIFQGDLQRTGGNRFTWLDIHAILFDHYLVLAKAIHQKGSISGSKHERYDVSKQPIPMDLLVLESTNDDPVARSSVKGIGAVTGVSSRAQVVGDPRHNRALSNQGPGPGTLSQTNTSASIASTASSSSGKTMVTNTVLEGPKDEKILYPFRVKDLGRDTYTLYASSAQNRQDWCEKILEAKTKHAASLFRQNAEPFRLRVIADTAFAYDTLAGGPKEIIIKGTPLDRAIQEVEKTFENAGSRPGPVCRAAVNCATSFAQPYGKHMVAVGTDCGVYLSEAQSPRGWNRVIHIPKVTQIAVLEEFSLFLVISDRSLIAYHLDVVCPVSGVPPRNDSVTKAPQKLSGNREVGFFATGKMKDRMLVLYKKREGISSTFKILEPVYHKASEKKSRFSRKGTTEFFREFDEYYIPTECFGINVFRSYVANATLKGFEVLSLDKKQPSTIPDLKQAHVASIAARLSGQRPLGMFRLNDTEFLLCYERCTVYVNKHGDISRSVVMDFVGKAKSAAVYGPYLILFDDDFVEIRNAENGRLRQVIYGRDVRCLDDAQTGSSAGQRTIKIALQHPEMERTQLLLELVLNEGQRE